jgi:hypothetical protein
VVPGVDVVVVVPLLLLVLVVKVSVMIIFWSNWSDDSGCGFVRCCRSKYCNRRASKRMVLSSAFHGSRRGSITTWRRGAVLVEVVGHRRGGGGSVVSSLDGASSSRRADEDSSRTSCNEKAPLWIVTIWYKMRLTIINKAKAGKTFRLRHRCRSVAVADPSRLPFGSNDNELPAFKSPYGRYGCGPPSAEPFLYGRGDDDERSDGVETER